MIHYEILVSDPDLGVIVRATDLETGDTGTGAAGPWGLDGDREGSGEERP